jgi:hypothetical protein
MTLSNYDFSSKKGWLRIWSLLSVVFLIFSSIYAIKIENENYFEILSIYKSFCERPGYSPSVIDDCLISAKKDADEYRQSAGGKLEAIIVISFVPLLIFWIFGFIFWRIYQWIKKGFIKK